MSRTVDEGNSNSDYGGLGRSTQHSGREDTVSNKETVVSPGAFSSSAGFTLSCEHPGITCKRTSTVTRGKQGISML